MKMSRWLPLALFALLAAPQVARHWAAVASANWQASADAVARRLGQNGVFVDIGSTRTARNALRRGAAAPHGRIGAQLLARCELVYQGVVRTPLTVLPSTSSDSTGKPVKTLTPSSSALAPSQRTISEIEAE